MRFEYDERGFWTSLGFVEWKTLKWTVIVTLGGRALCRALCVLLGWMVYG